MRCDEIKERLVELLYDETGTPAASLELQGHIKSCPRCENEVLELKPVQAALKTWKEEAPLRSVAIAGLASRALPPRSRSNLFRMARYAAVAALMVFAFLGLANADITWNENGFSFRTHLAPIVRSQSQDYYTRAETRDILRKVLDESESRLMDTNYLMMQRMLETIEQERRSDLVLMKNQFIRGRRNN
jgi:hypothetical protein